MQTVTSARTLLFSTYSVAEVSAETWETFFGEHVAQVFPDDQTPSLEPFLNATERTQLGALRQNLAQALNLYFLIYDGENPIGWHFGFQRGELEYFMANTGILPAYQGRGIYSAFLKYIVGRLHNEGFQYLTSLHHCDNNAVLIPKLKAGFLIQAMGFLIQPMLLEANASPMLQLVYPMKEIYREQFSARLGNRALKAEVSQRLAG